MKKRVHHEQAYGFQLQAMRCCTSAQDCADSTARRGAPGAFSAPVHPCLLERLHRHLVRSLRDAVATGQHALDPLQRLGSARLQVERQQGGFPAAAAAALYLVGPINRSLFKSYKNVTVVLRCSDRTPSSVSGDVVCTDWKRLTDGMRCTHG